MMLSLVFPIPMPLFLPLNAFNWVDKITIPPFTQDQSNSAVSYAVVSAIESAVQISTGNEVLLSVQNILDCAPLSTISGELDYILANGIDTLESYPYTGMSGPCTFIPAGVGARIKSYMNVTGEDELLTAVWSVCPVIAYVDASQWYNYVGGIDHSPCVAINHVVLIVGYTPEYFIALNSWGADWGMNGFIFIARGKNASCVGHGGSVPKI